MQISFFQICYQIIVGVINKNMAICNTCGADVGCDCNLDTNGQCAACASKNK